MRLKIIIILSFLCIVIQGQELKVIEAFQPVFEIIKSEDMKYDSNGEPCALVKVQLPVSDVLFEGNLVDVKYKVNEHWCYLTPGTKMFRIKCVGCQPFDIKVTDVESGGLSPRKCYAIKLELPQQMSSVNSRVTIKMYDSMMESREDLIKRREYVKAIESLTLLRDSLKNIREKELVLSVQNKIDFCHRQISLAKLDAIEFGKMSCGRISIKKGNKHGFVDSVGNVIVKPVYEDVCDFSNGVAWVKENGKWGIMSEEGATKLIPTYSYVCPIKSLSGIKFMKVTSEDGKFDGVADYISGREVLPCVYEARDMSPINYDYFCLFDSKKKKTVIFDKMTCHPRAYLDKGIKLGEYLKYGLSMTFKIMGTNSAKSGITDEQGNEILPCGYNIKKIEDCITHKEIDIYSISPFDSDLYENNTRLYSIKQRRFLGNQSYYGVLWRSWGKWICVSPYKGKFAKGINFFNVETEELAFPSSILIDTGDRFREDDDILLIQEYDGLHKKNVHAFHYDGTIYTLPFNEVEYYFEHGLARYKRNNKIGFVDNKGQIAIKPQYDVAGHFFINKSGTLVAKVSLNGESFYINSKGNKIL